MKYHRQTMPTAVFAIAFSILALGAFSPVRGQFIDERPIFDGLQLLKEKTQRSVFRAPGLTLLRHPRLFSDLRLSPLQIQCIRAIEADMMLELELATFSLQQEYERRRFRRITVPPQIIKATDKIDAMAIELISVALTPKQKVKFDQIRIQWEGPLALRRSEFRQDIGLTPTLFAEIRPFLDELVGKNKQPPTKERADELESKIMRLIPSQQRKKWDQLAGRLP